MDIPPHELDQIMAAVGEASGHDTRVEATAFVLAVFTSHAATIEDEHRRALTGFLFRRALMSLGVTEAEWEKAWKTMISAARARQESAERTGE